MRLPILSYGHEILKESCADLGQEEEELPEIIENMWETLYGARGVGLAAPQVDFPYRLFVVDSVQTFEQMSPEQRERYFDGDEGIREVFINPEIISRSEESWSGDEGCLSIPNLSQPIERPWSIEIEYLDEQFRKRRKKYSGLSARVVQHEYDHVEGLLILDHLKPLTRLCLKGQLLDIAAGKLGAAYPMTFEEKV